MSFLSTIDPEIFSAVQHELRRERDHLELIASENFPSLAVIEAAGSVLTNKYAEGYPGRRYYGGCDYVDVAETLAIERAKTLFSCEYANVQPHSGSQANMGVYFSVLKPGDTILGMDLAHGGHLTHGAPVSFSGKLYRVVKYGVDRDTETIDYDELMKIAKREKPAMIVAGASAYPRTLDFPKFRAIADEVGAFLMTDMAHIAGLVAAGVHPSPLAYSHFTTTTTHKTLRGPRGGMILIGKDGENTLGIQAAKSGRFRLYSELVDSAIFPGIQGGPLMHVIAAKAVAFKEALSESFGETQRRTVRNAAVLADALARGGARIVSGGTDNHLMLVDVSAFGISGKEAEKALDRANITCNKNAIPFDTKNYTVTSGIRLGTPALTTRGMGEREMEKIGDFIVECLKNANNDTKLKTVKDGVLALCREFPLYPELGE